MLYRPPIRRGMPQAGALLKKWLVISHVRWPTAWREARTLSEHITYRIAWAFAILDYQRYDLGTATCTFADSSLEFDRTRKIGDTSFGLAHYEQWNFLRELQKLSSVARAIRSTI